MQQVLFIHGGGLDGFEADAGLRDSLSTTLGEGYQLSYPKMPSNEDAPDFGWLNKIEEEVGVLGGAGQGIILVGHSLGASMLLKFLSQRKVSVQIAGVFLLAAPFWAGEEEWVQGLKLEEGFEERLPKNSPFFFYHCHDDEEVSFSDLEKYRERMVQSSFIALEKGGHQFEGGMQRIAQDIVLGSKVYWNR